MNDIGEERERRGAERDQRTLRRSPKRLIAPAGEQRLHQHGEEADIGGERPADRRRIPAESDRGPEGPGGGIDQVPASCQKNQASSSPPALPAWKRLAEGADDVRVRPAERAAIFLASVSGRRRTSTAFSAAQIAAIRNARAGRATS